MKTLTLSRFAMLVATVGGWATAGAQEQQGQTAQSAVIQHIRPVSERGRSIFEPPKDDTVSFKGLAVSFNAAFTQQFQALQHSNTAAPAMANGVNANQLI